MKFEPSIRKTWSPFWSGRGTDMRASFLRRGDHSDTSAEGEGLAPIRRSNRAPFRRARKAYLGRMAFSPDELERYARHIVMREVGGTGQQALAGGEILVVGAGGLGAPALLYLAAAGVGTLGIVDDESCRPLQPAAPGHPPQRRYRPRQGRFRRRMRSCASTRTWRSSPMRCGSMPAMRPTSSPRYDLVLDGSDNFATRYAVSDACFLARAAARHRRARRLRCQPDNDPGP